MQTKDDIPRIIGNPDDWEGCEEMGPIEELIENFKPPTFDEMTRAQKRRIARELRKDLKHEAKRRSK